MNFYVLHVITGNELAVRNALVRAGYNAAVPRENRMVRLRGKWRKKEYLLFPSYVFVGIEMLTDEDYHKIKLLSGIIKFLGVPTPQPISADEAVQVGMLAPTLEALEPSVIEFDKHGTPRVVEGILSQFSPIKINRHSRQAVVELKHQGSPKYYPFSFEIKENNNET